MPPLLPVRVCIRVSVRLSGFHTLPGTLFFESRLLGGVQSSSSERRVSENTDPTTTVAHATVSLTNAHTAPLHAPAPPCQDLSQGRRTRGERQSRCTVLGGTPTVTSAASTGRMARGKCFAPKRRRSSRLPAARRIVPTAMMT